MSSSPSGAPDVHRETPQKAERRNRLRPRLGVTMCFFSVLSAQTRAQDKRTKIIPARGRHELWTFGLLRKGFFSQGERASAQRAHGRPVGTSLSNLLRQIAAIGSMRLASKGSTQLGWRGKINTARICPRVPASPCAVCLTPSVCCDLELTEDAGDRAGFLAHVELSAME